MWLPRGGPELPRDEVFTVERKVTANAGASSCPEGHPVKMSILDKIAVELISVYDRQHRRITDRQPTNFTRGRQIALHQRRRHEKQICEVVEAARRIVGRQHNLDIQFFRKVCQAQEVTDCILILGPTQPMERGAAPGIRSLQGRTIQRRLQPGNHPCDRRLIWPRTSNRRHRADTQLAHDRFPHIRMRRNVRNIHRIEGESRQPELSDERRCRRIFSLDNPLVVTGHAIPVEHGSNCVSADSIADRLSQTCRWNHRSARGEQGRQHP